MRGLFGFAGNIFVNYAIKMIPLSKFTVLFYTNPFFIALFGWMVLKERITLYDMLGIGATFLGVYIFTRDPISSSHA